MSRSDVPTVKQAVTYHEEQPPAFLKKNNGRSIPAVEEVYEEDEVEVEMSAPYDSVVYESAPYENGYANGSNGYSTESYAPEPSNGYREAPRTPVFEEEDDDQSTVPAFLRTLKKS